MLRKVDGQTEYPEGHQERFRGIDVDPPERLRPPAGRLLVRAAVEAGEDLRQGGIHSVVVAARAERLDAPEAVEGLPDVALAGEFPAVLEQPVRLAQALEV